MCYFVHIISIVNQLVHFYPIILSILHQTIICTASDHNDLDIFHWNVDILPVLSQPLLISALSLRFSKAINLFEVWLYTVPSLTHHVLQIKYLHVKFLHYSLLYWLSIPNFFQPANNGHYRSQFLEKTEHHVCFIVFFSVSRHNQSDCVFASGETQLYLWILKCGNNVLITVNIFYTLIWLSLLVLCKLSFPVVTWKYLLSVPFYWNVLT